MAQDLADLLAAVARDQQITEEFAVAVANANLWLPVQAGDDGEYALFALSHEDRSFLPAFTSEEALRRSNPELPAIVQPYEWLVERLPPGTGVVFDPGLEPSLALGHAEARSLLPTEHTIPAGSTLRIGEPAEEPTAVLDGLAAALATRHEVVEARRCWAQVGDQQPGLVVGLGLAGDVPPGTERSVFEHAGGALDAIDPDFRVDFVLLESSDPFADWMLENAAPFYTRS